MIEKEIRTKIENFFNPKYVEYHWRTKNFHIFIDDLKTVSVLTKKNEKFCFIGTIPPNAEKFLQILNNSHKSKLAKLEVQELTFDDLF